MGEAAGENNFFLRIFFPDIVNLPVNPVFGGLAHAAGDKQ